MPAKRSLRAIEASSAPPSRLTSGPAGGAEARERDLIVMFTDIVGFTELAERLSPGAVAEILLDHLGALAQAIEDENGTVDKVLGDGLLAFWDGLDGSPEAAAPALRAALAIRQAVAAGNALRAARGESGIRLRVGLHTGRLVMAPLGASGRLGVAMCGDTVNVAQRLEDAARHVAPDGDVTILASDAVVARAGAGFRFRSLGELPIRGRREPIRAFRVAGSGEERP